jgi:pilus assembly protein CpaF
MSAPIIVLINAKGGSGATTLTIEVAQQMKKTGTVAVVDGDLTGRRNMAVVLDVVRNFDNARAGGTYSVVRAGGITAVELTDSLDNSFMLRQADVEELLASLDHHDVILVDAPAPFTAAVRPFVARAARFVIVLEPNLLGTAAARTLIGDLTRFGIPVSRMSIVTNVRDGRAEISSRELEKALGAAVIGEIPPKSDRNFARAIDSLAKRFSSIGAEPVLTSLRASTATPPGGDRRGGQRAPRAASQRSEEAGSSAGSIVPAGANGSSGGSQRANPEVNRAATARDKLKTEIHSALAKKIDVVATSQAHSDSQKLNELRAQIGELTSQLLAERPEINSVEEAAALRQEIIDEVLGLGPLEDLMRDDAVTEIMVNGPDMIYVERAGVLTLTGKKFVDMRQLRNIIERIIAPLGRRIDESSPMVDARLPDGSRVNAIIEPLALNGATLTIRRFGKKRLHMGDLVRLGAISENVVNLVRAMVQARLNIIVSGGTGSGKTTFLNILSSYIPDGERIITIEDAAELHLEQQHVVRLEARPANLEGRGEVRIRDLVKNSLRMRPDRIVVGECRGGEALDMLQAMNTGHDGSLTTLHANTPRDAVARLETLVMMAGFDLPVKAIREQVASAVDVIVQISRLRDGSRKIISLSEVIGMEGDVVTMQEIIRFDQRGVDINNKVIGEFQYTGVQPNAIKRFEEAGVTFDVRELAKMPSAGALW